ncbi:wax ester/triacylglycerol synthase family O-acyltransferase [Roseateles saccharophilus]|uniref:diacylglycerol O-acyltransferase n=1 Tax=Roseateles saccharophilus TaxID=304 RepID=A0A4R3UHB7_ROSSA|nr:wax ester/triacylglycerol synthase family O-acyltransferase [Roseateles saccharophilus]MDG0833999.1 wax ester/triacylglycerol synthase family O-acyltransferase [Roseateles saccharophilus]TCU90935.1 WS/DGAT/MGAT family acyltransferase [Roseateles saccharophilus]
MKQLAGLDASFLYLETPQMPMHVGALHLLELPVGYDGDYAEDLREHMRARMPLLPALRRRLLAMPLGLSNPGWVDAEPDLDEHIVEIALPNVNGQGSGMAELEAQVGLLHPVLLDRSRPLWKFHVFTGLESGPEGQPRVALYTQLHHAAVDGQAAVALAQVILDLSPEPRAIDTLAARGRRRGQLGTVGMLRAAVGQQWKQTVKLARSLPNAATILGGMAVKSLGGAAAEASVDKLRTLLSSVAEQTTAVVRGRKSVASLGPAPRTRFNVSLSATRSFAGVTLPLADLNRTRKRHGASLNDAVLFVIGGALRRYFAKHGPLPRRSLIAAVPVSTRAAGDTTSNNQATMTFMSLGTQLGDPAERLTHVMASSKAMKAQMAQLKSLMPTDFPSMGIPWLMQAGAMLYGRARVAEKLPVVANVVISNVPGPQLPLYLAGAKMLTNYPTSIAVHGLALNVTVQTYNQSLDIGLMACGEALPETAELAAYVEAAFMEFQALPVAEAAPAPAPTARKAAAKKAPSKKVAAKKPVAKATPRPRASTARRKAAAG